MEGMDLGSTGAKRQTWRNPSPREILRRLLEEYPNETEESTKSRMEDIILADKKLMSVVIEYWFTNNYRSLTRPRPAPPSLEDQQDKKRARERAKDQIKDRIKQEAKVMLLCLMLPHGKTLANSTGAECSSLAATIGPWLSKIAAEVGDDKLVGEVLTEDRVRQLFSESDPSG